MEIILAEIDFTQYGIAGAVLGILFWFLKGPVSRMMTLYVESNIATQAKMIQTMESIREGTATTVAAVQRNGELLDSMCDLNKARHDQIVAEVRVLSDAVGGKKRPE